MNLVPVTMTADAAAVWAALDRGFAGDPAVCNWMLSAIDRNRRQDPGAGFRYWMVISDGDVTALAMLSPAGGRLDLTPMATAEAVTVAEAVVDDVGLDNASGVLGHAATAAAFAGRWTELANVGARPTDGGRVLEVRSLVGPTSPAAGVVRPATADDLELLVSWNAGFAADTDVAAPPDAATHLSQHISAGSVWIWERDHAPLGMSIRTASVMSTRRLAHVYTPPEHRGKGIAAALVHHLAAETLAAADRCMLHTQLANPSSNGIYRRLGFEAVCETTYYEFF